LLLFMMLQSVPPESYDTIPKPFPQSLVIKLFFIFTPRTTPCLNHPSLIRAEKQREVSLRDSNLYLLIRLTTSLLLPLPSTILDRSGYTAVRVLEPLLAIVAKEWSLLSIVELMVLLIPSPASKMLLLLSVPAFLLLLPLARPQP